MDDLLKEENDIVRNLVDTERHIEAWQTKKLTFATELEDLVKELNALKEQHKKVSAEKPTTSEQKKSIDGELDDLDKEINDRKPKKEELERHIKNLRDTINDARDDIENWKIRQKEIRYLLYGDDPPTRHNSGDLGEIEDENAAAGHGKNPGIIQSVLFDKNSYTVDEARKEFEKLGYTMPPGKKVHVTQHFIRMRVVDPDYQKYDYRTIWFSDDGSIRAIYGYPKASRTFISQRYRR